MPFAHANDEASIGVGGRVGPSDEVIGLEDKLAVVSPTIAGGDIKFAPIISNDTATITLNDNRPYTSFGFPSLMRAVSLVPFLASGVRVT